MDITLFLWNWESLSCSEVIQHSAMVESHIWMEEMSQSFSANSTNQPRLATELAASNSSLGIVVSAERSDLPMISLHEYFQVVRRKPPQTPTIVAGLAASLPFINLNLELTAFLGITGLSNPIPLNFSKVRNASSHLSLR